VPALAPSFRVATCSLVLLLAACGDPPPPAGPQATPRPDDPELVHSWQMPPDKSVLWSADLGSKPPALADALMAGGKAPGLAHRSATACAQQSSLDTTATVALRLTIAEGGAVSALEGDPAGPASDCLVGAVRSELAKLEPLPAGVALMLLRFHAAPQKK
jgi:hypothetical protein